MGEVKALSERKNLIIDPSFFAHTKASSILFESELSYEYCIIIPTQIYNAVLKRDSETFISILGRWEQIVPYGLERVWSEIVNISPSILENTIPCAKILEELSPEQRSIYIKIDKILQMPQRSYDHPCFVMAKEIIETACVSSLVVSISERAKRWYDGLSGTIVKRVEENDKLMKAKEEIRNKMKQAGWKGTVLIWLCKHVPITFLGDVIDTVLILSTDGAYKCQNCGRSLYRLPNDIVFCPYCSKPLV